jgi:hypothetical protein
MLTEERKTSDFKETEDIKLMNLEEFCDWYPEGFDGRFELHNGEVINCLSFNRWFGDRLPVFSQGVKIKLNCFLNILFCFFQVFPCGNTIR